MRDTEWVVLDAPVRAAMKAAMDQQPLSFALSAVLSTKKIDMPTFVGVPFATYMKAMNGVLTGVSAVDKIMRWYNHTGKHLPIH